MKICRHIILLLSILAIVGSAKASAMSSLLPTIDMNGIVTDCKTQEPLFNVTCIIDSVEGQINRHIFAGVTTDSKGAFVLKVPANKHFHLSVHYVGYNPFDTMLFVSPGEKVTLNICLKAVMLKVVDVSADRRARSTFTTVEKIQTQHMTGANEGIEALLKTLPDVSSNNDMSSQFSVRGGSFDENLVYINDVEIYRPMLIRSGQQEGMSIINPDMVSGINFSPGGFDATYGDRMASVLDITYYHVNKNDSVPVSGSASLSFLGANLSLHGKIKKFDYSVGFRQHSNRYVFGSLDTKGDYTTKYTDLQTLLGYSINDKLKLEALCILSRNVYGLIPETQTTDFGSYMENLELNVYFDGQEQDRYRTVLGSVSLKYYPNDEWSIKWINSFQHINENEIYDIQSQYWLYELNVGAVDTGNNKVDRGVGSYLEHARNYMSTSIWSTELKGSHYANLGDWKFGLQLQREQIDDRVREWKWVDSAGYTMPFTPEVPGDSSNQPQAPVLQKFCVAHNQIATNRLLGYVYRDYNFLTANDDRLTLAMSVRGQLYSLYADTINNEGDYQYISSHGFVSPRLSLGFRPHQNKKLLFRFATGIYSQSPFYREYRRDDGSLNLNLRPQHSYQAMGTVIYDFDIWQRPFQLTTDIYYKYITNLVAYRIDNLRVRYDATNDAVGYATGVSMRLNGEFIPNVQSWASLSVMKTQEDLLSDTLGWLDRPTDQRISFKVFFQDYVPRFPFWQMSLSFITGSGLPTNSPNADNRAVIFRLNPYFRVDWGNTLQLSAIKALQNSFLFKYIDDIWLTVDVFNLFDRDNEVSYIWVADYDNNYYPVPNKLTGRQVSAKITVTF